jgi:hypothetical protein
VTLHVAGEAHTGQTTNVSRGGLCADLPTAIPVGSEVEVDMQLMFDDGAQSDPLRILAWVVWCTTLNDTFQVGVAFRPLPA